MWKHGATGESVDWSGCEFSSGYDISRFDGELGRFVGCDTPPSARVRCHKAVLRWVWSCWFLGGVCTFRKVVDGRVAGQPEPPLADPLAYKARPITIGPH